MCFHAMSYINSRFTLHYITFVAKYMTSLHTAAIDEISTPRRFDSRLISRIDFSQCSVGCWEARYGHHIIVKLSLYRTGVNLFLSS